jgi:CHAD domain-containing protein
MESSLCTKTLGNSAYQAIAKHYKKFVKREAEVYQTKDPEQLHQMRVELRRLRTAMQVFAPVVKLPSSLQNKQLSKVARCLGAVRDLDVLLDRLQNNYLTILPDNEAKHLQELVHKLQKQRDKANHQVKVMLESEAYQEGKQTLQAWLDRPKYRAIASIPLPYAFPTLLLPLLSQLLLHPGWFVGVEFFASAHRFLSVDYAYLVSHQSELHDLRKNIKQVRYQAEFFLEFYGDDFAQRVNDFAKAQTILGYMQDRFVLNGILLQMLKIELTEAMPTLAEILIQHQVEDWQSWHQMQQNYLNPEFRNLLYQTMISPGFDLSQITALSISEAISEAISLSTAQPSEESLKDTSDF